MKHTIAHVTHEAVEKIGGIGTVLEGLLTSPIYQGRVGRSILVGPCACKLDAAPETRLGEHGTVLYSSVDRIDDLDLGRKLRPIEWAFDVSILYGKRTYEIPGDERTGEADVLLIDVFKYNHDRLGVFKHRLAETFGIDSKRYEEDWGFEEYVRLAEPAFYALTALLRDEELPCVLFSHEFMGLPAAFKATLDGGPHFRTLFHAHECATARRLVEDHPGHDLTFYNAMRRARERGVYVEDVFGDLSDQFRHALVSRAHVCDGVIAVGDDTAREMHFLGDHFDPHRIDLVYNGVPTMRVTPTGKARSREMLVDYAQRVVGYRPDVLMTHVMRPVISKGLWRDFQVCDELDRRLGERGRTGVLFILTSAGGVRRPRDIRVMERDYGWPAHHREGYPDLVGPEVEYDGMVRAFNAAHQNLRAVLVNQFGWSRERIGERLPEGMHMGNFRAATDVEFGMATYEPFGISPLEPLCAGAVCVISTVCGCAGFVREASEAGGLPSVGFPNVLIADYTRLDRERTIEELLAMTAEERDAIEQAVSADLAAELMRRVPATDAERNQRLETGRALAAAMGWDRVMTDHLLPVLDRVTTGAAE